MSFENIDFDLFKDIKQLDLDIFKSKISQYNNCIFCFYMYDLYSNKFSKVDKQKLLMIIDILIAYKHHVIVFLENKIRQYNFGGIA